MIDKPTAPPARAHFSSGPCAKRPGWTPDQLATDVLGRSHRSKIGKARLKLAIDLTREVLEVPSTHRIGIVPASDTGAYEMAMWSLLGQRPASMLAWESFGEGWVTDAIKQLKLAGETITAPYGELPDLTRVNQSHDVCFTWNGTTSGVRVPNGDWIRDDREGLTLVDATSAVFAQAMPWHKIDVLTYSWQKVLGGEGGHGMLILGPRAVERLESYTPAWPLPKIFRLTSGSRSGEGAGGGKLIEGIFSGETINTPSMLAVEDYIDALQWSKSIGGLPELMARADANAQAIDRWVTATPWVEHLATEAATRSNTSVCLTLPGTSEDRVKALVALLDKEGAAYDIGAYRDAPPGLRIWCGATVDTSDIALLTHWLDWGHAQVTA